jgi:hypothetical protein
MYTFKIINNVDIFKCMHIKIYVCVYKQMYTFIVISYI